MQPCVYTKRRPTCAHVCVYQVRNAICIIGALVQSHNIYRILYNYMLLQQGSSICGLENNFQDQGTIIVAICYTIEH